MRTGSLSLSLGAMPTTGQGAAPVTFVFTLTGLAGGEARPGDQASIGYTITPDTGTETVQWGTAQGDATYGTGPNPTDFTAGDGGSLWLTVADGSDVLATSALIRHAAPTAAGVLSDVIIAVTDTDPITTAGGFTFLGTPLYSLETAPAGLTINPDTGAIDASGVAVTTLTAVIVRLSDANDPSRFAESGFSLTVEDFTLTGTADGEIEIGNATGQVTITVISPAAYATYDVGNGPGVFIFDAADLAAGPVNIVPPRIVDDGSPAAGETLTITPGLWVYDADTGGLTSPGYQWQSNAANIADATSDSYALTPIEAGDDVRVLETLTDNGGTRTATSPAIRVVGGTAWSAPTVNGTDNGEVTLAAGANTPSALSAPTINSTGDGEVTLNAA